MSGFTYTIIRPEVETSEKLEKKIADYARENEIRMSRARGQLIEWGLAVAETELPEMKEEGKIPFRDKVMRLYSLMRKI